MAIPFSFSNPAVMVASSEVEASTPTTISITSDTDVTLRVIAYKRKLTPNDNEHENIVAITNFEVNREILSNHSQVLRTLLETKVFAEAGKDTIDIKEHRAMPMKALFCALYGKDLDWASSDLGKTTTKGTMSLTIEHLWDLMSSARFFMIETIHMDGWFQQWHEHNSGTIEDASLLFPCFHFNHAEGFAAATKGVIYDEPRVYETKSEKHEELHLPPNVFQQMCAARGRLKTVLHYKLWDKLEELIKNKRATCPCKAQTVLKYLESLMDTKGFPVDKATRHTSISRVLLKLGSFKHHFNPPGPRSCRNCGIDWVQIVNEARVFVETYFDGLCLDCMDHTKPKFRNEDDDYWNHLVYDMDWDKDCRISHGQATWYYSFMGRADTRDKLLKRIRLANPDKDIW